MRKQLYEFIEERLKGLGDIKHIDIWNQQLIYPEAEQAFETPAVFIEFGPIGWSLLGGKAREADVVFNLHIATDSREERWRDNIEVFELLDRISHALTGEHDDEGINSITPVESVTDADFGELMHNEESFKCHVIDMTAARKQTAPAPQKIKISLI
ncbi:MAG: hypothetical protein IKY54_06335 [Muribaculaceae bacterium]|nr:hypothetical protein [Muribaculaceae bacterium]